MTTTLAIETTTKEDVIDITDFVETGIAKSKIKNGKVAVSINQPEAALTSVDKKPTGPASEVIKRLLDRASGEGRKGMNYDVPLGMRVMMIGSAALIADVQDGKLKKTKFPIKLLCELNGPRKIVLSLRVMHA